MSSASSSEARSRAGRMDDEQIDRPVGFLNEALEVIAVALLPRGARPSGASEPGAEQTLDAARAVAPFGLGGRLTTDATPVQGGSVVLAVARETGPSSRETSADGR